MYTILLLFYSVAPYMGLNFALFETFKFLVDAVTTNVYIHVWDFNNRNSKRDGSEKMALPSVVRNGLSGIAKPK